MAKSKDAPSQYQPPEKRKNGPFDEYEVRDAMRTLSQALKIKKNPALLRACKKAAQEALSDLTKSTAR